MDKPTKSVLVYGKVYALHQEYLLLSLPRKIWGETLEFLGTPAEPIDGYRVYSYPRTIIIKAPHIIEFLFQHQILVYDKKKELDNLEEEHDYDYSDDPIIF